MKKTVFILGVLALGGAGLWWGLRNRDQVAAAAVASAKPGSIASSAPVVKPASVEPNHTEMPGVSQSKVPTVSNTVPAIATAPTVPASITRKMQNEYEAELDTVRLMLSDYRTLMQENPVGSNAEIMKALMGDNPKHAKLGPPGGERINEKGELTDRWGTPYFFHQMSATVMEIRSAGPDRTMWTPDDVTVR